MPSSSNCAARDAVPLQVREYRRMLVKEHEDLYQAAISDTNKTMCDCAF
jgi:hypothetical protein